MRSPLVPVRTLLLLAAPVLWGAPDPGPSKEGIEGILGRPGTSQGAALCFEFPRADLNVLVQGVPLDPQGMVASQVSFFTEGKGVRLQARLFVMDMELPRALGQALRHGLHVEALDDPFGGASPSLRRLHLSGHGSGKSLAWAVKMVLDSTGTPTVLVPPTPGVTATPDPWKGVRSALGPGEEKGRTLQYRWGAGGDHPASGGTLRLVLQKAGKGLAVWGEWLRSGPDGPEPYPGLLQTPFRVTAWTRSFSAPPEDRIDLWALGEEKDLIQSLRALLEKAGLGPGQEEAPGEKEGQE